MTEQVITEDQSGHGLDHGNGPGKNTGIMPPATLQFCVRASVADGHEDSRAEWTPNHILQVFIVAWLEGSHT